MSFDVVIVGAGLVGASLYHALQPWVEQGFKLLVVEQAAADAQNIHASPSFDDRSTALSLGSQKILSRLNLWSAMVHDATAIKHIEISDQGNLGVCHLDAAKQGFDAFGYVVPNRALGSALMPALLQANNVEFAASIDRLSIHANHVAFELNGETQQAKLMVLAEGGRSELAKNLGFTSHIKEYQQQALIFNVTMTGAKEHVAYERFSRNGPVAFLPLGGNKYAVVLTMESSQAAEFLAIPPEQQQRELIKRFGWRLGEVAQMGEIAHYPLAKKIANEQVRSRLVLCGNSAVSLHPVAGQGFNLALRSADRLAKHIGSQFNQGADVGALSGLLAYQKDVQQDQYLTAEFSHQLIQLFAFEQELVRMARGFGLYQLNKHRVAKRLFSQFSMGML